MGSHILYWFNAVFTFTIPCRFQVFLHICYLRRERGKRAATQRTALSWELRWACLRLATHSIPVQDARQLQHKIPYTITATKASCLVPQNTQPSKHYMHAQVRNNMMRILSVSLKKKNTSSNRIFLEHLKNTWEVGMKIGVTRNKV